ncbi:hypothetical protein GGR52DRAFT_573003 [Hypoxylon sp. FL1284]|nr:hypothetical protein GGR52DRAFT_573003 [Hypoxylon sp. FL1284]
MVSPVGTFFIVLILLAIIAAASWIIFTQLRARRLGLPAPPLSSYVPFARSDPSPSSYGPQPAPGGVRGWISDRWRNLRGGGRGGGGSSRSAAGAYERPSRRGFGALDPDEAWDARVGHEADDPYYGYGYEEQELGLRDPGQQQQNTAYGGGYSNVNLSAANNNDGEHRGRPVSRDVAGGAGASRNPFDDEAEPSNISLRGVSPRPIDTSVGGAGVAAKTKGVQGEQGATHESPTTAERRSIFRENV